MKKLLSTFAVAGFVGLAACGAPQDDDIILDDPVLEEPISAPVVSEPVAPVTPPLTPDTAGVTTPGADAMGADGATDMNTPAAPSTDGM